MVTVGRGDDVMSCSTETPISTESPVRTMSTVVSQSVDGSQAIGSMHGDATQRSVARITPQRVDADDHFRAAHLLQTNPLQS